MPKTPSKVKIALSKIKKSPTVKELTKIGKSAYTIGKALPIGKSKPKKASGYLKNMQDRKKMINKYKNL